ncbi:MAG: hypothetical protein IEMM0008_1124 [bacterium]|nr:MAG: hypothetical protein IEMM0008_1124 [bacterium]
MKETYKPYDTEELLDYFFYRPLASLIVKATVNTSVTPNQLTILSLIFGMASGVFFYYGEPTAPFYSFMGLIFLVVSAIFDCSDGQLARARPSGGSMGGRVFDGIADNLVFFSIYLFSVLKFQDRSILGIEWMGNYGWTIWAVAAVAAITHSMQSSFFDYYRNEYISFVITYYKSEGASANEIKTELDKIKGVQGKAFERFLLWIYYGYTKIQEKSTKNNTLRDKYEIPLDFDELYKNGNLFILRLWSGLGGTAHLTYVMIFAAFQRMDLYFIFEVIFLNIYMIGLKLYQNRAIHSIEKKLTPLNNTLR